MRDEYDRRARIYPSLLAVLPISVSAIIFGVTSAKWWSAVAGLAVASGFWVLMAQIGRHPGKAGEPSLFAAWGGTPSTILLRHRDNANPIRVTHLHDRLSRLTGLSFPTAVQEATDPKQADHTYEAATDYLRNATRSTEHFPLVFEENCNYGFRRNVWGLRPWAIGICMVAVSATTLLTVLRPSFVHIETGSLVTLIILDLVVAIGWWKLVTPEWVKQPALAYAQRLLETTDSLTG